jgi:RNA polymerase sigma-70 factor (ECF subfamily)
MLNDILLITKIKEGNMKAFEEVFRLYYAPLCLYASCIMGQTDTAEEVVQELFYVLWRDRNKLQLLYSLKGYLYGAVRNQSLQYLEHEEVKKHYHDKVAAEGCEEDYSSNPQNEMEFEELQKIIFDVLGLLPERCSRIFRMHRFEGKKYTEIASELQISVKTVEAEMTKALKTLRNKVEIYI